MYSGVDPGFYMIEWFASTQLRGFEGILPQEYLKFSTLRRHCSCIITRGLGACSPKKIWNLELSECNFPAFWEHFKPLRHINSTSPERHNSHKKSILCVNPSQPKFTLQFNNILQCKIQTVKCLFWKTWSPNIYTSLTNYIACELRFGATIENVGDVLSAFSIAVTVKLCIPHFPLACLVKRAREMAAGRPKCEWRLVQFV